MSWRGSKKCLLGVATTQGSECSIEKCHYVVTTNIIVTMFTHIYVERVVSVQTPHFYQYPHLVLISSVLSVPKVKVLLIVLLNLSAPVILPHIIIMCMLLVHTFYCLFATHTSEYSVHCITCQIFAIISLFNNWLRWLGTVQVYFLDRPCSFRCWVISEFVAWNIKFIQSS